MNQKKKLIPTKVINKTIDKNELETESESDKSINSEIDSSNFVEIEDNLDLSVPHINRELIEKIAQRKVKDLFYYQRALVHKSIQGLVKQRPGYVQEYMKESNERLEFLGDSVFGSAITFYLFNRFPDKDEGFLTKVRTRIVKSSSMSKFSEHIGIRDNILMSPFVVLAGGKENKRFLEDAFEAFVGAMRIDLGQEATEKFCLDIIYKYTCENDLLKDDNYKDLLLRFCQSKKLETPIYECIKEDGLAHKKEFTIQVKMYDKVYGTGISKTKKKAEQIAAKQAVETLGITENSFKD
jgi:ribonuclease-3